MSRKPGDHGKGVQAIYWILHVCDDTDPANQIAFLAAWEEGSAEAEWPEFFAWLDSQP